jgi:hypothetical protein
MSAGRRRRGDEGQLTVLIIGFTVVIVLMVVVVTDISKVFLVRRDLDATADGAVLAAANGLAAVQPRPGGNAAIDPERARQLTAAYLDDVAAGNRFDDLDWAVDVDGTTVRVRLTTTATLPFRPPGFPGTTELAAEAAAIVALR